MAKKREMGGVFDLDMRFATFTVGGALFGMDITNVKEIVACRKPHKPESLPDFVDGYVLLRNLRVPLFDLRRIFESPIEFGTGTRVIVTSFNGRIAGLVVDAVVDVELSGLDENFRQVPLTDAEAGPGWLRCVITSVVNMEGLMIYMLDENKIFGPSEAAFLESTLSADPIAVI